jgi:protein SCO1/2
MSASLPIDQATAGALPPEGEGAPTEPTAAPFQGGEAAKQAARQQKRSLSRLAGSPLLWLLVVAVGLGVPIANRVLRPATPPLPVLATLPAFTLTAEDGRAFGSADLRGYVWMAGFIFTRCPTICPVLTGTMGRIQRRARGIEQGFRMVSFSVDPQYDTPQVLAEYARKHKASPRLWRFLTGSSEAMKQTVVDGLKISMGAPEGDQDFASIFHGTHFVLVDQQGRIRGYYDSSNPEVVDQVLHDAAMLINRGD